MILNQMCIKPEIRTQCQNNSLLQNMLLFIKIEIHVYNIYVDNSCTDNKYIYSHIKNN